MSAPVCPRCKSATKLRTSQRGAFYSCTRYPACRGTVDAPGAATAAPRSPPRPPALGRVVNAYPIQAGSLNLPLDDYQRTVVNWRSGHAVVAASAGSGKSTVLVERTLALLREGVLPETICLLAFNADAAESLRARLATILGPQASRVNVYTFHAWCYAVLRNWDPAAPALQHGHILGIGDAPHPIKLAAPILEAMEEDISLGAALRATERMADALIDLDGPSALQELAVALHFCTPTTFTDEVAGKTAPLLRFCKLWQKKKAEVPVIEFSDMLYSVAMAVRLHWNQPHVQHLCTLYDHVMVDECQDISKSRALVSHAIGWHAQSYVWVGDSRQSVYMFAGAEPDLLTDMATAPGTTLLTLPVNRRSTAAIVEAANQIARGRYWNLGGDAMPRPDAPQGEAVVTWVQKTPTAEAEDIITDIQRRIATGRSLGTPDRAVYCCLARTNAMLAELECAFVARDMPVRLGGAPGGIWGTSIGRELLAYLEGAEGHPTFGLLDVANKPKRFAKKVDVAQVIEAAAQRERAGLGATLLEGLCDAASPGVQRLGRDLRSLQALAFPERVKKAAKWLATGVEDVVAGDQDRKGALEALVAVAIKLGSLSAIHEYKVRMAGREREPAVLLSTIHKAKGQEYPVVYVTGVRVKKLPHERCDDREEERRLLYVAVTRARDVLRLSTGGKPSAFLDELGWA